MAVVLELYMFTPEYSRQVKKRETRAKESMAKDFIPEQGTVLCLNTYRENALSFFNLPELLDLIDTAYNLSHEQGHGEPIRELGERDIPRNLAKRGVLELTGPFQGRMTWDGEEPKAVESREQLRDILQEKVMIEPTFLGGADKPR